MMELVLASLFDPTELVEIVVQGLAKSSLYLMLAAGLTLIFGLMGVLNFAHGSLTMYGAYLGGMLVVMFIGDSPGMSPVSVMLYFVLLMAVVFVALGLFGVLIEMALIRKLYDQPALYQILLTFGLTLILDEILRIVMQFYDDIDPSSTWTRPLDQQPAFLDREYSIVGADAQYDVFWIPNAQDYFASVGVPGPLAGLLPGLILGGVLAGLGLTLARQYAAGRQVIQRLRETLGTERRIVAAVSIVTGLATAVLAAVGADVSLRVPGAVFLTVALAAICFPGLVFLFRETGIRNILRQDANSTSATQLAALGTAVFAVAVYAYVSLLTDAGEAATVSGMDLFEILMGTVTLLGVWLFLSHTRYGLYIRAGTEDEEKAEALGIDVKRIFTLVFGIGTGIAGVAGMLIMWDLTALGFETGGASITLGTATLLPAFVVVIIGGLGTFKGTVIAALMVGIADELGKWLFVTGAVDFPQLPTLTLFGLLTVMLILRPQGLLGVEEVGDH